MGIDESSVEKLVSASAQRLPVEQVTGLVTDAMVNATYVAGSPEDCKEKIIEICESTKKLGIRRMAFSKIGPNLKESLAAITQKILPAIQ